MEICRTCKVKNLKHVINLGPQPPAQGFLSAEELASQQPEPDLDVYVCLDCALIQVPDKVPEGFFSHYLYVSSSSDVLKTHFDDFAALLAGQLAGSRNKRVVDIGSCDGVMLSACAREGLSPIGIEPASNLAEIARQIGHAVYNGYFSADIAHAIRREHGPIMAVTTSNTFNIIDDLDAVIQGVKIMLDDDGMFIVEVPQAVDLIEKNEFDTIYHEHLSQFSVHSMVALFACLDMRVYDIETLALHGGSMRVFAVRESNPKPETPRLHAALAREKAARLFDADVYTAFRKRVEQNKAEMVSLLGDIKNKGEQIAAYGAAAKGTTLLNYYGLGPDVIDFIADRNEMKHGLCSPRLHIPVTDADEILARQPDYVLMLAWNFGDEILQQQKEYIDRGGKFIIPIPSCRIVDHPA